MCLYAEPLFHQWLKIAEEVGWFLQIVLYPYRIIFLQLAQIKSIQRSLSSILHERCDASPVVTVSSLVIVT
jgi:hypothetical protein